MRAHGNGELIGTSVAIIELVQEIERIARSDAKVLVTGESGVGKELVASAIHRRSTRATRQLVTVNCAGLPETLLESELFGHVKGSFTGAYRDKIGKLELADGGTIFLDEIAEMSPRMQGLLLRFMETGELQKVGSDRITTRVNVRVIAATNRNLRDMISEGTFREDLFYRLNVIHLTVPALRERREDIPPLIEYFLGQFSRGNSNGNGNGNGQVEKALAPDSMRLLCEYSWPGNVRELENVIERLVVTGRSDSILPEQLPIEVRMHSNVSLRPKRERRRTVADDLYKRLTEENESFWAAVYPLYMEREITKGNVRDLVRKGLEDARGNYKIVAKIFNMEQRDYKRFLNFLRKHDCQVPFKEYRQ
ncbi:MAG: sigma-54-dependent Fis family transcriptional regulator [Acidobacteria bacterium]|nr:sigma-54-dependent Fis family transcriptional regulator [Acidobacteriota bacterium]